MVTGSGEDYTGDAGEAQDCPGAAADFVDCLFHNIALFNWFLKNRRSIAPVRVGYVKDLC